MDEMEPLGEGGPPAGAAGAEGEAPFDVPFFLTEEYDRRRALRRPRLADGTVFAGHSPDTGAVMHTLPNDESPHPFDFCLLRGTDIAALAGMSRRCGHGDWRIPSPAELQLMFRDRELIRGFGADWYWTSCQTSARSRMAVRFSDGCLHTHYLVRAKARLRLVRTLAP